MSAGDITILFVFLGYIAAGITIIVLRKPKA